MTIEIKETGSKGSVIAINEIKQMGEMTFSIASEELIIIDHTDVDEEFRGQDVGKQMLLKLVEDLRTRNIKVIPLCPFARSVFDKMDEIKDVLK